MADGPRWLGDLPDGETGVALSEQQLVRLATGEAVTVPPGDDE